jgi:TolB-like protein
MDAPTPPPAKPAAREPKPRRNYRAVPVVLVVVLLAINVGLTGRVAWQLERQERQVAQPPTLADVGEGLAKSASAKGQDKAGKKEPAPTSGAAFTFDSVAVLPFSGPGGRDHKEAVAEAERAGPALAALLAKDKRPRVVPFDKVRQLKERSPQAAGRALGARAIVTGAVAVRSFVGYEVSVRVQLIDTETGLTVWAKTTELGPYTEAAVEWKQKLTEALVAAAGQVRAHAAP